MSHGFDLLAPLCALLLAQPAKSEPQGEPPPPALVQFKRTVCIYTGCFLEPFIPDLRLEWATGRPVRPILSWPVHPLPLPYLEAGPLVAHVSPFLEPQYAPAEASFRLLGGARLSLWPASTRWGVLLEGAARLDAGGWGSVVGAGLTYDLLERHRGTFPWTVSLVARRVQAPDGLRWDAALDVMVPLPLFTRLRPWGGD